MDNLMIQHKESNGEGVFYIEMEGDTQAYLTYEIKKHNTIIFTHTVVKPTLRGQGIARKLVEQGIDFAREKDHKIIPQCSYVASYFHKHPELSDRLQK